MSKFLVILRDVQTDEIPYPFLSPLPFKFSEFAPLRWSSEMELELTDEQLSAIREAIIDPKLHRHLPPEGQSLHTTVSLYFQQALEKITSTAANRIRVVQIPEPLPAEMDEFVPCDNPGCQHCNPKNPWARGY